MLKGGENLCSTLRFIIEVYKEISAALNYSLKFVWKSKIQGRARELNPSMRVQTG
jgi:hypothetical protein